jgi:pyruvate ferredoxin oxidoreductase alpha subunit
MKKCIEGSRAIAEAVNLCRPEVVAAYPITPQTHIVENLSQMKADGEATFEYLRSESEFAAASMVLGGSAAGSRTYTASSSQGLLLMTEVIFTIAGMRLPVVMTCANRAISAPINIWNDQQDAMTMRDSGWIMLFAEDNQEAFDFHVIAFKVAEQLKIPVMVNVDGFVLTHTFENVDIPEQKEIDAFLPKYVPEKGQYLDVRNPVSLGAFVTPEHYQDIRMDFANDLNEAQKVLIKEFTNYRKQFVRGMPELCEFYGDRAAKTVFVAMGSVAGTIKEAVDELNSAGKKTALVRLKCFRPLPVTEIVEELSGATNILVVDKSISLGSEGVLAMEIKTALSGKNKAKIKSFVTGLGGRDITREMIKKMYEEGKKNVVGVSFV